MRGAFRRAVSPATVIAGVALIFSVGGTSYAVATLPHNSVGTAQIRSHAVTTAKLATTASARIAGLTYQRSTVMAPPQSGGPVDVPCPSGLTAISGGVETSHSLDAFLMDSHPDKTGWEASVANSATTAEPITVYAICAKVQGGSARSGHADAATARRFRPAR